MSRYCEGGHAVDVLEDAVEGAAAVETGGFGDVVDGVDAIVAEEAHGVLEAQAVDVFVEIDAPGVFFDEGHERVFADAGGAQDVLAAYFGVEEEAVLHDGVLHAYEGLILVVGGVGGVGRWRWRL